MFLNKSLRSLVFAVLSIAGLAFLAIPATAAVTPVLSVPDADDVTAGIQVYGIRAERVSFELTVTFQDTANNNANTAVNGFAASDITLHAAAADSNGDIVPRGAAAGTVRDDPNNDGVYTTTITVEGNITTVLIGIPRAAANTVGRIQNNQVIGNDPTGPTDENMVVNIVRSAAPPLTISADTSISGKAPFTVTLTSTKTITLKRADIHVTGGDIPTDGLSSDTTGKVWTVTIRPVIDVEEVIVRPATNGAFIFPKGTFTVGPQITRQGRARDLAGKVAISEIMFATNGNANEIQWIEIFNSSQNESVALDADRGWRLIIENYDDPELRVARLGSINFKEDGDVKTIPPRQAVLIVSTASTRNSNRTHFKSTRVFDVYAELAGEFGMNRRVDPFLHPTQGFHIELVDGRSETVDTVGNLDGRTGTSDKPAWQLPNGWVENRYRTSIIRRYRDYNPNNRRYTNKGTVHDGTKREAWIPAEKTKFTYVRAEDVETWYGISSDRGTPGIHAGGALPVQLAHFRPERTEAGAVVIKWTTESEVDNAGFNILRAETKKDVFKVVNAQLIPGAGTTSERNIYTWTDTTAKPNVVYYYQIEDVSFAGERQTLATSRLKGTISANDKLTTQWSRLKLPLN